MKILWYALTAFFGLIGILGFLRAGELLMLGKFSPVQIGIALGALLIAAACLRRVRTME